MAETSVNTSESTLENAPLPFASVIGQEKVRRALKRIISNDRLSHANLFLGYTGTGRLALAIELARVLNCSNGSTESSLNDCNCRSCMNIRGWKHPNLFPVFPLPKLDKDKGEAAEKALNEILSVKRKDPYNPFNLTGSGQILIDQVRELRNRLTLTPDRKGIRTIVIQPADRMTEQAANALLKILEEPPDKCCLILIAESTHNLLPTIVSRCQVLQFSSLTVEEITGALVQRNDLSINEARIVARMAEGSFTRALTLVEDDITAKLNEAVGFLREAVTGNAPETVKTIENWLEQGNRLDIADRLKYINMWIKEAIIFQAFGAEDAGRHLSTTGHEEILTRMASRYRIDSLESAWHEVEEARLAIYSNANISTVLVALALRIRRILT